MISDDQLMEWSQSGKSEYDVNAYNRFKYIITDRFDVKDVFLQGSYANSTGVFSSSDVDIVAICEGYYINSYDWRTDLKRLKFDLYDSINYSHNFRFELGKKTIKYRGSRDYSPTDILPCITHISNNDELGIAFFDYSRNMVIYNYPKQHISNGIEKNKRTGGAFKKTVRVFKNLRDILIDEGLIQNKVAPSYFIECLLYNVPDSCYDEYIPTCFYNVINWLLNNLNIIPAMHCQNCIHPLFNVYNGWTIDNCHIFLGSVIRKVLSYA